MNYDSIPLRPHTLSESEWLDQQARDQKQLLPLTPSESREQRIRRILAVCKGRVTTAARLRTK